ncbi:hypothetical protein NIES4075_49840 [Tolypothrix sp. NIES-4075]|nr:hypothetical protein NIES4075_49840 [Tolypothrix sp. NIES-4075]
MSEKSLTDSKRKRLEDKRDMLEAEPQLQFDKVKPKRMIF